MDTYLYTHKSGHFFLSLAKNTGFRSTILPPSDSPVRQDCDSSTSAISGNLWQVSSCASLGLTEVVGWVRWWVWCFLFFFPNFFHLFVWGVWKWMVRGLNKRKMGWTLKFWGESWKLGWMVRWDVCWMVRGGSLPTNKWGYEAPIKWPHYRGNWGYNPTYI